MGLVGIWCMHFIGNCAVILDKGQAEIQLVYHSRYTVLSLDLPIVGLVFTFLCGAFLAKRPWLHTMTHIGTGIFAGLSIVGMHYVASLCITLASATKGQAFAARRGDGLHSTQAKAVGCIPSKRTKADEATRTAAAATPSKKKKKRGLLAPNFPQDLPLHRQQSFKGALGITYGQDDTDLQLPFRQAHDPRRRSRSPYLLQTHSVGRLKQKQE